MKITPKNSFDLAENVPHQNICLVLATYPVAGRPRPSATVPSFYRSRRENFDSTHGKKTHRTWSCIIVAETRGRRIFTLQPSYANPPGSCVIEADTRIINALKSSPTGVAPCHPDYSRAAEVYFSGLARVSVYAAPVENLNNASVRNLAIITWHSILWFECPILSKRSQWNTSFIVKIIAISLFNFWKHSHAL